MPTLSHTQEMITLNNGVEIQYVEVSFTGTLTSTLLNYSIPLAKGYLNRVEVIAPTGPILLTVKNHLGLDVVPNLASDIKPPIIREPRIMHDIVMVPIPKGLLLDITVPMGVVGTVALYLS